jgi:organic radical activating enzyme
VEDLAVEARRAADQGAAFVVITGGEPLQHDLGPLCGALGEVAPLHLETSGVHPLSGRFDWITLSPKPHRPPRPELLARCDELKVVVTSPTDLAFAEAMAAEAGRLRAPAAAGPVLLLQPAWDVPEAQALAVAYVRAHPAWRLSLQSHKWLGVR